MLGRIVLCFALLFSGAVGAQSLVGGPAPGLWWNPEESGRGFTIDLQDSIMVVTSYVYTPQGAATWYVSAGTYNAATRTFTATFDANSGGQCLGCAYMRPQGIANAGGPIRIVFDSYTSGQIFFDGGSARIVRQMYGYADRLAMMRGSFSLSFKAGGLVIGDWLVFNHYERDSNNVRYVAGYFDGYPTSRLAVGTVTSTGESAFLLRDGDYYDLFLMSMDDHRLWGRGWTYRVTSNPSGSGSPAYGVRMATPNEIGAAPNAIETEPKRDPALANLRESLMRSADATAAPDEVLRIARELEARLR